jgi:hypothetical protein
MKNNTKIPILLANTQQGIEITYEALVQRQRQRQQQRRVSSKLGNNNRRHLARIIHLSRARPYTEVTNPRIYSQAVAQVEKGEFSFRAWPDDCCPLTQKKRLNKNAGNFIKRPRTPAFRCSRTTTSREMRPKPRKKGRGRGLFQYRLFTGNEGARLSLRYLCRRVCTIYFPA